MSPSSSGSWSAARGADIIDLDRYMRGAVRPTRPISERSKCRPTELVVDAGMKSALDPRHKRYSHDSGVSDSSYSRHRRLVRSHRRLSTVEGGNVRSTVEATSTRIQDSSDSLRAFRTVCEQTLLEQQRQIAHVAQLCEKLTERAEKSERGDPLKERIESNDRISERSDQKEGRCYTHREWCDQKESRNYTERNTVNERPSRTPRATPKKCRSYVVRSDRLLHRREKMSSEMSDISSSSRSTKDPRRKDKHRTQQCKTYKIIMSKLDELNRLFSSRPPPAARTARPHSPSSSSVSVCDKLVATDPQRTMNKVITPSPKLRRMPVTSTPSPRRVTQAFAVDIAPGHARALAFADNKPNVVTESVVKSSLRGSATSAGDPRCGFDLDDPVHLYSQAKKLQTMTMTTVRRGRSVDTSRGATSSETRGEASGEARHEACAARHEASAVRQEARHEARPERRARHGSPSLCAVCRDYWRYLRQCLVPQMFSAPDHCQC